MVKFKSRLTAAAALALTCLANAPAREPQTSPMSLAKAPMPAIALRPQIPAGRSNSQSIKRQLAARSRRSTPPIIGP